MRKVCNICNQIRGSCESATSCGHNSEQLGKVEMRRHCPRKGRKAPDATTLVPLYPYSMPLERMKKEEK